MTKLKIDENEYELDSLSDKAKAITAHLHAVNFEIDRLQAQTAIYHTARAAYIRSLKEEIDGTPTDLVSPPPPVKTAPTPSAKRGRGKKVKAH